MTRGATRHETVSPLCGLPVRGREDAGHSLALLARYAPPADCVSNAKACSFN